MDQAAVRGLINACVLGDLTLVREIAARPRVGVRCLSEGTFDTPLHA